MKTHFILIISATLMFHSCGEEETILTKDLTLNLKVEYKGQPLAGFQPFEYPNGYNMFLPKFSLFISNVELIAQNKTVRLAEIAFIDPLDGVVTDDEARLGKSIVIRDVPIDQYSSIRYSIGVPSDLNALTPADF